jgi:hypothetical protein
VSSGSCSLRRGSVAMKRFLCAGLAWERIDFAEVETVSANSLNARLVCRQLRKTGGVTTSRLRGTR